MPQKKKHFPITHASRWHLAQIAGGPAAEGPDPITQHRVHRQHTAQASVDLTECSPKPLGLRPTVPPTERIYPQYVWCSGETQLSVSLFSQYESDYFIRTATMYSHTEYPSLDEWMKVAPDLSARWQNKTILNQINMECKATGHPVWSNFFIPISHYKKGVKPQSDACNISSCNQTFMPDMNPKETAHSCDSADVAYCSARAPKNWQFKVRRSDILTHSKYSLLYFYKILTDYKYNIHHTCLWRPAALSLLSAEL